MHTDTGRNRLLVALDVEDAAKALDIAAELRGLVGGVKVGSRLFTSEGPSLVKRLVGQGNRVFLDLKFHDIPNTVAQAVEAAVSTGAWMINVHASGGLAMMRAAAQAGIEAATRIGSQPPLLIGVTVLTSMDEPTLGSVGVTRTLMNQVVTLAGLARDAGLHGVVASPLETSAIRAACGPDFVIVTPGIRGGAAADRKDDQSRTMAPGEAVRSGASYIVVGRPITAASDRRAAAQAIVDELEK